MAHRGDLTNAPKTAFLSPFCLTTHLPQLFPGISLQINGLHPSPLLRLSLGKHELKFGGSHADEWVVPATTARQEQGKHYYWEELNSELSWH